MEFRRKLDIDRRPGKHITVDGDGGAYFSYPLGYEYGHGSVDVDFVELEKVYNQAKAHREKYEAFALNGHVDLKE